MFHKIVVEAEGYSGGADALRLAETLAVDGAELVLTDAYPQRPPLNAAALASYEDLLAEDARRLLDRRRRGRHIEVRVESIAGRSAQLAVWETARRERADLVVIGASYPGADVGRILSYATADRPPCPVARAPRGYHRVTTEPRVIGVGVNDSPDSIAALRLAQRLADSLGARLHVRAVAEVPAPSAMRVTDCQQRERKARSLLARILRDLDSRAAGDVVVGTPGDALQALSQHVDLMLTGTPSDAKHWRLIDAIAAERLLAHAGCPVIVVPREASPRQVARFAVRVAAEP